MAEITYVDSYDGKPLWADRADKDENGDRILTTYAKISDVPSVDGKADKVSGATGGDLASLDADGNLVDSGIAASDVVVDSDLSTVATTGDYNDLQNKPSIPAAQVQSDYAQANSAAVDFIKNKPDLSIYAQSANLATVATTGSYNDLTDKPDIPSQQVQSDWTEDDTTDPAYIQHKPAEKELVAGANITISEGPSTVMISATAEPQVQANWAESDDTDPSYIQNKPSLSTVATSGNYNDLSNKPVIPAAQVQADYAQSDSAAVDYIKNKPDLSVYAQSSSLATVATTGDYDDLTNRPTIPAAQVQADYTQSDSTAVDYIKHKPDLSVYAQSANLATVATTGSYNDLQDRPSIPAAQVQADYAQSDNTATDYIKNKPDLSVYAQSANLATVATSGAYSDLSGTPDLSLKEDVSNKKQTVDSSSTTDYPSSAAVANYVDQAVSSNSGRYISDNGNPFSSVNDLPTSASVVHNNDYAIVLDNGIYTRYKASVTGSTVTWAVEYQINTSPLSQAQQDAVNSGITAALVTSYSNHVADTDIHVTTTDKSTWNAKQDAISDLSDIRSGSSAGSTAVQPSDLAAVATSGDYADLLNKPTIPAAQVQADYAQSDSSATDYIKNKPDLSVYAQSSSLATVATTGAYNDLSGTPTINNVPAVTSSDDSKVLKASYSGGVGTYSWETESGGGGSSYTAGVGIDIDITSDVISADIDGVTIKQASTTTTTSINGAGSGNYASNGGYIVDPGQDIVSKFYLLMTEGGSATIRIPDNTFYFNSQPSEDVVLVFTSYYHSADSEDMLSGYATALSTTTDPNTGRCWVDEQDIVLEGPAIGASASNWIYPQAVLSRAVAGIGISTKSNPPYVSTQWAYASNYDTAGHLLQYVETSTTNKIAVAVPVPSPTVSDTGKALIAGDNGLEWSQVDYSDVANTPDLSVYAESANLATVATSGSYADLSNKPSIPTVSNTYSAVSTNAMSGIAVASAVSGKQNTLTDVSDIVLVNALPASPVSGTLYLIPET